MALYIGVQTMPGPVGMAEVASAHEADLKTQTDLDLHCLRYWVDEKHGKVFCLVDAPDAETASEVHRKVNRLAADEIYPVAEGV